MTDWSEPVHKERKANEYELKVYVSDPYYHVEVFKNGKKIDEHLLSNDHSELESLVRKYERM